MGHDVTRGTTLRLVMLVVLIVFGLPLVAAAQPPAQVRRIALLELAPPPGASSSPFLEAFRHELRERGWVEGHNLALEWRSATGDLDRFATLVAEVIRLPVELIVVPTRTTASLAHKATTTIPIVAMGGNLIGSELIASPARPGGNVTGVSSLVPEVLPKQLELLKHVAPGVTRVAVLRGVQRWEQELQALEEAARAFAMELHRFEVREPSAVDSAFAAIAGVQAHALLVLPDPSLFPYHQRIAELAVQHHLPSICWLPASVRAGCLMSYGASQRDRPQRIATYVDKILRGANPADLPVEQPMQFDLVVNLKTATALGITVPPSLLFQANEVIR